MMKDRLPLETAPLISLKFSSPDFLQKILKLRSSGISHVYIERLNQLFGKRPPFFSANQKPQAKRNEPIRSRHFSKTFDANQPSNFYFEFWIFVMSQLSWVFRRQPSTQLNHHELFFKILMAAGNYLFISFVVCCRWRWMEWMGCKLVEYVNLRDRTIALWTGDFRSSVGHSLQSSR